MEQWPREERREETRRVNGGHLRERKEEEGQVRKEGGLGCERERKRQEERGCTREREEGR